MAVTHPEETYTRAQTRDTGAKLNILVVFFLFSLLVPLTIELAGIKLLAYRAVALLLFFPAFIAWCRGQAGPRNFADYAMIGLSAWFIIAMVANHGLGVWQTVGVHTAELLGCYLLGRAFVRTPEQFFKVAKLLVVCFSLLLPFALIEALTAQNVLLQLWSYVGSAFPDVDHEQRLGFDRVQGPFEHPIHFGVYGGALIGLACYVYGYGRDVWGRIWRTGLVALTAFFSLSSGPLAAMTAQFGLIAWDVVLRDVKSRWWILAGLVAIWYVAVDILSNRTPIEVMISYFALNAQTGYGRILIFDYGMQNALANPLFGIGFDDWVRPAWLTDSVDMFWIYYAMIAGLPAGFLVLAAYFGMMISIIKRPLTDPKMRQYRMGWIVTMVGLFMAGWMVHFWKVPFVLYSFLLGTGGWFLSYQPKEDQNGSKETESKRKINYTRFPVRQGRQS
ncbi:MULTISPECIES: O-antigen ligase [unclassified Ruegeria]|uniref:O-antigen ligase family protein n=1 Tax=unclassified Ruegeria TaxID=2625375 RepID=UPI001489ECC6|nr:MULTISPECIES: hypothetical protein [unclassified Ruegeria]